MYHHPPANSLLTQSSHQEALFETETFILKITFITTFWDIKCRENLHKYEDNTENQYCGVIFKKMS